MSDLSLDRTFLAIVLRRTQNLPLCVVPQIWVKPRKSNVSGFPLPRLALSSTAKRPKAISRVFASLSSRLNCPRRSRSAIRERFGFFFVLKSYYEIVGITHDDYVAARVAFAPLVRPQVKRIV